MPSFDVVSEIDHHELANAVDQVRREIGTRFDFKGVDARIDQADNQLTLVAEVEFQLGQMLDMLRQKLVKRGIETECMEIKEPVESGKTISQVVILREGIDPVLAKKIVKLLKESKIKVQASIQGEQVRVNGKKRDDLQEAIQLIKSSELELPLQFNNFRD